MMTGEDFDAMAGQIRIALFAYMPNLQPSHMDGLMRFFRAAAGGSPTEIAKTFSELPAPLQTHVIGFTEQMHDQTNKLLHLIKPIRAARPALDLFKRRAS